MTLLISGSFQRTPAARSTACVPTGSDIVDVWGVKPAAARGGLGISRARAGHRAHQAVVFSLAGAGRFRRAAPWPPPPWRAAAGARSASRPASRPASRCRAGARRSPARPSPGAGWGRRAVPVRVLPLDAVALEDGEEAALDALQAFAQLGDDVGLVRAWAAAGWSRPRCRFSAASTTSGANFCTAYWRVSSTSRWARARTLAISASERIQRSFISCSSASSSAIRAVAACIRCSGEGRHSGWRGPAGSQPRPGSDPGCCSVRCSWRVS